MKVKVFFIGFDNPRDYEFYIDVERIEENGSYTTLVRKDGTKDTFIQTGQIAKIYTYEDNEEC